MTLSFVKKAQPPPEVEEGDILEAKILTVQKVTSQWKDNEGNPREQLQFDLELDNGYKFKSWMAFYEQPSDRSKMGKLALKLQDATGKTISNPEQFLSMLKEHGRLYVSCEGFREYEGDVYPNFSIVASKIPRLEKEAGKVEAKPALLGVDVKALLTSRFAEAVKMGLPLNERDWNSSLLVSERVALLKEGYVEYKANEGLYFFTRKAEDLFR